MLIFYQQSIRDSHRKAHPFDYLLEEITEMKTKLNEAKYYYAAITLYTLLYMLLCRF